MHLSNFATIIECICQAFIQLLNAFLQFCYIYWMHFFNFATVIEFICSCFYFYLKGFSNFVTIIKLICQALMQLLNEFGYFFHNYWIHFATNKSLFDICHNYWIEFCQDLEIILLPTACYNVAQHKSFIPVYKFLRIRL